LGEAGLRSLKEEHLDAVMLIEKASFPSLERQAYAYD
jgi:hypothetical protein